jgi:hypothetical protein
MLFLVVFGGLTFLVGGVVAASSIGFMAWLERRRWVRFHERGVAQTRAGRTLLLPYEDLDAVTWSGALALEPIPGRGHEPIVFRLVTWNHEADLASVRDLVCRPLASRMLGLLERGGEVPWTNHLTFLADGLWMRPRTDQAEEDAPAPAIVPYEEVSYRLERKGCSLFVRDDVRPAHRERTTGPNFFVGLLLLEWLRQGRLPAAADEAAPRPTAAGDERVTPGPAEAVRKRDDEERP